MTVPPVGQTADAKDSDNHPGYDWLTTVSTQGYHSLLSVLMV